MNEAREILYRCKRPMPGVTVTDNRLCSPDTDLHAGDSLQSLQRHLKGKKKIERDTYIYISQRIVSGWILGSLSLGDGTLGGPWFYMLIYSTDTGLQSPGREEIPTVNKLRCKRRAEQRSFVSSQSGPRRPEDHVFALSQLLVKMWTVWKFLRTALRNTGLNGARHLGGGVFTYGRSQQLGFRKDDPPNISYTDLWDVGHRDGTCFRGSVSRRTAAVGAGTLTSSFCINNSSIYAALPGLRTAVSTPRVTFASIVYAWCSYCVWCSHTTHQHQPTDR